MADDRKPRVLLGLIGSPIKHSASPAMHEAAGAALGLHCFYHLVEVAGADRDGLRAMLVGVRRLGFSGVNVTYPYKEAVVPLLDEVAPAAARIGAVNTVVVRDGRLVGHNTDATGFARALVDTIAPRLDRPVALVGAGGVGRAIAFALADLDAAEIRIFDRDPAKSADLVAALGPGVRTSVCHDVEAALTGAAGLINGTPVGMLPNRDSPVPSHLLRPDLWVADAVYSPLWTPLLDASRRIGAQVMTGRELALHQALDAFRLFTGLAPSRDAMASAFDAVMAARHARAEAA